MKLQTFTSDACHRTNTVHAPYIRCTRTVHTLHMHHTYTVHALYIHCTRKVHTLYMHCTYTVPASNQSDRNMCLLGFLQVAQALGITLPGTKPKKRKATAAQASKTLSADNPSQQQQQPPQQQPALPAAAVATAQVPLAAVKRQRRAAVKPPQLPGEWLAPPQFPLSPIGMLPFCISPDDSFCIARFPVPVGRLTLLSC